MNDYRGFTLIELLIVVVIIGILAATADAESRVVWTRNWIGMLDGLRGPSR